jgi:hypothetical protein
MDGDGFVRHKYGESDREWGVVWGVKTLSGPRFLYVAKIAI